MRRALGSLLLVLAALTAGGGRASAAVPLVVVLPTTGVVDSVMSSYLTGSIRQAAGDGAAAVVIELNTPGGSLDSMQQIVSGILEAPIPVIVWVAPAGGRAASAGTFITLAANLSYMAQGTNIGAASPVGPNGEDIPGTLGVKVKNDAIANITSIATARHRPVDWAVSTVDKALSYPASAAVSAGAVDGIADSLTAVLAAANGKTVTVRAEQAPQQVVVNVAGATIDERGMSPVLELFHVVSDPNVAFLLFLVGVYALLFEFVHPTIFSGLLGAVAIILAFVGFGNLPLNIAGLMLVGLSVILFVLEQSVTSHGLLTVGAVASLILGAAVLYGPPAPGLAQPSVAWPLVAVVALAATAFALVVVRAAFRIRRSARLAMGVAGLVGSTRLPSSSRIVGEVRTELSPLGSVHVDGEEWSARSASGAVIPHGSQVRVVAREGLVLIVEPLP